MQRFVIVALLLAGGLSGCQRELMPTPNIYVDGQYELYGGGIAEERQSSKLELIFVTDRAPEEAKTEGIAEYGWKRSRSLGFGTYVVEFGKDLDWDTVLANSTTAKRSTSMAPRLVRVTEEGRFPAFPAPGTRVVDDRIVEPEEVPAQRAEARALLGDMIRQRLAETHDKSVWLHVHGFNNTFEYAALTLGELFHWRRHGVPILYTWPAGSPGLLKGYTTDRESGEFTVFHLKQLIRGIAEMPEVEAINVVAHSRGTDVATSALREILIAERAAGRDAAETMKLKHLVLLSPDLDFDVITQRFAAEGFFAAFERGTVYVSRDDQAIGAAEWLMRSRTRLGRIEPEDFSEADRTFLDHGRLEIIDCRVRTEGLGHSYFRSSPAVSSDVMLMLEGFDAGSPERPLKQVFGSYWLLDDEAYPFIDPSGD